MSAYLTRDRGAGEHSEAHKLCFGPLSSSACLPIAPATGRSMSSACFRNWVERERGWGGGGGGGGGEREREREEGVGGWEEG